MNAPTPTPAIHQPRPAAKHTPGPWMQGPTANTWHKVYEGKKGEYGGRAICTLHNIHANGARQKGDFETENANARLIAKAPDMFSAIQDIISSAQANDANSLAEAINEAERIIAAIYQAEGGAQ